jgi:hypothetical protein
MASIILKIVGREKRRELSPTLVEHNSVRDYEEYRRDVSFPPKEDMIQDVVIGVLFNGCYEKRRVVLTKNHVIFSEIGQHDIVDFIPIADIFSVDDLDGITAGSGEQENQSQANIASLETVASTLSAFQIRTIPTGYNCGRKYCLQADSDDQCEELIKLLDKLAVAARRRKEAKTAIQRSQDSVRAVYNSTPFQMSSALLIFLNFLNSAIDAQLADQVEDDGGVRTTVGRLIDMGNTVITVLFLLELLVNLYAHWLREFLSTWTNIWDAVIVGLSVASLGPLELAMPITILRFFRVVRILRVLNIFSRLPELKRIISALSHSLIPMLNAFLIVLVVMAIYSIIGVTYFQDQAGTKRTPIYLSVSIAHCPVVRCMLALRKPKRPCENEDRPADRQTDRQPDRQTPRQTDIFLWWGVKLAEQHFAPRSLTGCRAGAG